MNYDVLKSELTTDPESRGYSGMTDAEAATDLNTEYRSVDVESVTGQQIFEAAVPAEYDVLTADQKALFGAIVGMGEILVNGPNTRDALLAMFGPATTTRTNLAVLQTETVSRAIELGLSRVREGTVTQARAS
ncbi:hypothetical protein LCGC14_1415030 [marine sediment metagenome]|uniref:Uncharacterized protein n=1 Tax=marine sediment metagenome TaxID=412755 RepID=A0A0F9M8L0_9ZZZZ|nr:hypothetical protein [Phycisphaerae bacterium]